MDCFASLAMTACQLQRPSSSVMAGLVPAIHVLRHLGMDLFETIAK
jgi:hypothetical protein